MSRPKPKIIFEHVDRNFKAEEVLEAETIYAVCYDGQPINLRTRNKMLDYPGPKYKRSAFPGNPGHAFNLAERLNKIFDTNKFAVHRLVVGPKIDESNSK